MEPAPAIVPDISVVENSTPDENTRALFYDLYARSLFYDQSPRAEQKKLTADVKKQSLTVTYHPKLVAKTRDLTLGLVDSWQTVAQAHSIPWNQATPDDKIQRYRDVMAHYDAGTKKELFAHYQPTCVVPRKTIFKNSRNDGAAARLRKHDKFYVPQSVLQRPETYALATTVHENTHLLITDFHDKLKWAFHDGDIKGMTTVNDVLKAMRMACGKYTYEQELAFAADYVADTLQGSCDPHFLSTADAYAQVTKELTRCDKRYNWYTRSPEEAFVRTAECYAALLYGENVAEIDFVLSSTLYPPGGKGYLHYATAQQFGQYLLDEHPEQSMSAIMRKKGMLPDGV